MEIELNSAQFWKLYFCKVFETDINFFDKCFHYLGRFPYRESVLNFQINDDLTDNFDDIAK